MTAFNLVGNTGNLATVYRHRSKKGLQRLAQPWDWLSLADVRKLVTEAYRSASYGCSDPDDQVDLPREYFADQLAQAFECLVKGAAADAGLVVMSGSQQFAAGLREDLPDDWRPQYPVYEQEPEVEIVQAGRLLHLMEG